MKKLAIFLPVFALAALVAGCAGGAYEPKNTNKYNVEAISKFVLFDADAQRAVTCTGLQEGRTAEGRLKVVANLRNRVNRRIEMQANCVFKDAQGFPVDDAPFRTVILDENATEGVSFESFNTNAVKYTIRVRNAR